MSSTLATAFVEASRAHLVGEYVPKIQRCLAELGTDDVWWRPNGASNSVANLVLHLCGNARQWILHGVLGEVDVRTRDEEFAASRASEVAGLDEHLKQLAKAVAAGFDAIAAKCESDPDYLLGNRVIQGLDVTVLQALYHVVEHFGQHTGQIIYITKLRTAGDLGFWDVQDGIAAPNW